MKTLIKQPSQVQKTRDKYKRSRKYVQSRLKLSDVEYQTEIMEKGLDFLEKEYPGNELKEYYFKHAESKTFWKWFLAEWKQFEFLYVIDIEQAHLPFKTAIWLEEIQNFIDSQVFHDSFYSIYLKSLSNEKI